LPSSLDAEDHEALDDEIYLDAEIEDAIRTRTLSTVLTTDFLAGSGTDPFYFVGGNTKLSEKTGRAMGTSMVPFPRMYSNALFGSNPSYLRSLGPTHGFGSTSQPTGSKRGYSSAPLSLTQALDDTPIKDLDDVFNIELRDEEHIELIKRYTYEILRNNQTNTK